MKFSQIRQRFKGRRETSSQRSSPLTRLDIETFYATTKRPFSDAAVLLPLFDGEQGVELLLTQRAEHLVHHAGQVSFPGGRKEEVDADLEATAVRETFEETGIHPANIEIVGHLPRMYTMSYYDVDPVVALLHPGFEIKADPSEVKEVFSVPLAFFADADNRRESTFKHAQYKHPLFEFQYQHQRIWGATALMIVSLLACLDDSV